MSHCRTPSLLPLMIILITASLSSNTYNKASWCENRTFEGTQGQHFSKHWTFLEIVYLARDSLSQFKQRVAPFYHGSESCFQGQQKQSNPTNQEQGIPSNLNPASKEMISDSVELCETAVCFLHIQLIGTNVSLPKMHNVPPEVDFESSRSPAKSEPWNSPSLCNITHIAILFVFTCVMNVRYQSIQAFVTSFGPFFRTCKFVHWP